MAKYVQYYSNGKEAFNSFYNNEEDSETGEVIKGSFKIEVNGEEIDYGTKIVIDLLTKKFSILKTHYICV